MRYSITSNLRSFQRIKKNRFSTGKNWISNTSRILCIPQNFWPRKGLEYLYQLFDVLPKETTCEMKALQVYKVTFNYDFMMNRELILLWPEITLDMYSWVTLFLTVSCRISFIKIREEELNNFSSEAATRSVL